MHGLGAWTARIPRRRRLRCGVEASFGRCAPQCGAGVAAAGRFSPGFPRLRVARRFGCSGPAGGTFGVAEMPPSSEAGESRLPRQYRGRRTSRIIGFPTQPRAVQRGTIMHFLQSILQSFANDPKGFPPPVAEPDFDSCRALRPRKPVDTVGQFFRAIADGNASLLGPVVAGMARGWPKGAKANLDAQGRRGDGPNSEQLGAGEQAQLLNLASKLGSQGLGQVRRRDCGSAAGHGLRCEARRAMNASRRRGN